MSDGNNRLAVLAADIRAAHQDASRAAMTLAERTLAAGTALIEAKRLVAHGKWQLWLRENCGMSERTARRYMAIASSGMETATVAVLGIRGASEALGRARAASEEKSSTKNERDVPTANKQASTDRYGGSQTAGVKASANDLESHDGDTVNRGDPQDPDHDLSKREQEAKRARPNEGSVSNQASTGIALLDSADDPPVALTPQGHSSADSDAVGKCSDRHGGRAADCAERCPGAEKLTREVEEDDRQFDLFMVPMQLGVALKRCPEDRRPADNPADNPQNPRREFDWLVAPTLIEKLADQLDEQIEPARRDQTLKLMSVCGLKRLVRPMERGRMLRVIRHAES